MQSIRPASVAGMFYPGDARGLRAEVDELLAAAALPEPGAVAPKLIVVPHAGYVYSGAIAASAYARIAPIAPRIRRVVLLGPVHRVAVRGLAAPTVDAFETPLGRVPIDRAALWPLKAMPQVVFDDRPHAPEHSLEVQLPFLQAALGSGFSLVPLAVGEATPAEVAAVLERLWGGDETLIVISTDLSHYHPYAEAARIDHQTIERVVAMATDIDPHEACGARALNGALLAARRHGLAPTLLDLRNSGDTAGDRRRVVGYGALAFAPAGDDTAADDASERETGRETESRAERQTDRAGAPAEFGRALLARARNSIARRLGLPAAPEPHHPEVHELGATFVTLTDARGRLRGCIGRLEAIDTLDADVRHNAENAAFRDPRFAPVSLDEWQALHLEVSVLTPAEPLPAAPTEAHALRSIEPGVHGVIFEWRGHRATFLPQVWEQLPEPVEFMSALKRKAGLKPDFWHADVRLSRYRVTKFEGGPIARIAQIAQITRIADSETMRAHR
jgi:hypothetical protein